MSRWSGWMVLAGLLGVAGLVPAGARAANATNARTVLAWFPRDFNNWDNHAIDWSAITHLSFRSVVLQPDGTLKEPRGRAQVKQLVDQAHARGVKVSVLVWGTSPQGSSQYLAGHQETAVRSLVDYVAACNLDAVDLDDETWRNTNSVTGASNRDLVTEFLGRLSKALKAARPACQLFWDSPPVVSAQDRFAESWPDYRAIAELVDGFAIMAYEINPPSIGWTTARQPVAGGGKAPHTVRRDLATCIADYLAVTGGRRDKLLLGVRNDRGGTEWDCRSDQPLAPIIGKPRALGERDARANAAKHGPRFDEQQKAPWYCHLDGDHWVQGWYEDEVSLAAKLSLAREQGLQGICLWVLDGSAEPPATFDLLREHLREPR